MMGDVVVQSTGKLYIGGKHRGDLNQILRLIWRGACNISFKVSQTSRRREIVLQFVGNDTSNHLSKWRFAFKNRKRAIPRVMFNQPGT